MGSAQQLQEPPDVELLRAGDKIIAYLGPILKSRPYRGGLFARYSIGDQDFVIEQSDGNSYCGCIFLQSENYAPIPPIGNGPGSPENYTSIQPINPLSPGVVTLLAGGNRAYFKMFETVQLNGGVRNGPPIVYVLNEPLRISENGLLCNDPVDELLLVDITTPQVVGIVSATPLDRNSWRLGVDMR